MVNIISTNTFVNYIDDRSLRHIRSKKKPVKKQQKITCGVHKCKTTPSWYVKYKLGSKWKRSQFFENKRLASGFYRRINAKKNKTVKKKQSRPKNFFVKTKRNSIPGWIKDHVAYNQSWKCNICNKLLSPDKITDHIIPLQFNGKDNMSNYQTICSKCNRFKTYYFDNKIIKPLLLKNKRLTPNYFINIQKKEFKKILCK